MRCNNETTLWLFRQCNENARILRKQFLSRKLQFAQNICINSILCEPFVASGISYPSMIITMKKNCPVIQEVKISLCMINYLLPCSSQLCLFYICPPCTAHFCFSNYFLFSSQMHSPRLGEIVDSGNRGCRTSPPACVLVGRYDTLCRNWLYHPSQGLWIWLQLTRQPP
jgi:hypothetical protein